MVCQHNTNWSSNTLVPNFLEPNRTLVQWGDSYGMVTGFNSPRNITLCQFDSIYTTGKNAHQIHPDWKYKYEIYSM